MRQTPLLFGSKNFAAWLVLLCSVLLTVSVFFLLKQQNKDSGELPFKYRVDDLVNSIQVRMQQHEQLLLGSVGLFDASQNVSRGEWKAYVSRLNLTEKYQGVMGMGVVEVLHPEQLSLHVQHLHEEGFANYAVYPAGERDVYAPIVYLEPFTEQNQSLIGFDMFSEPVRKNAMREAVNEHKTVISRKVQLTQVASSELKAGFLMYIPVYKKNVPLNTESQRWSALFGFVYSLYRMDDLMGGVLGNRINPIHFEVYAGTQISADNKLYQSANVGISDEPVYVTQRTIEMFGETWTLRFVSTSSFEQQFETHIDDAFLWLGLSISLLLFFLVSTLSSRQAHAEDLALKITEDIRVSQQRLRQNEARLQAILDGAGHLIVATDTQGVIQLFNRAAEQSLGYSAKELIGSKTPALFHLSREIEQRAAELTEIGMPVAPGFEVFVHHARLQAAGETREWTYVRRNGSEFPVSLTVTAIRDTQGVIIAFLGIATDITERVLAAQTKRDDAVRLKAILDHVLDGIITINDKGIIQSFNLSAEKIFGYHAQEVVGRNIKILMPDSYNHAHDGYIGNYLHSGERKIIGSGREFVGLRKDGQIFPMELAVTEMVLAGKILFTGIVRDITERKRYDDMLRKLSMAVEQCPVAVLITDALGNIEYVNEQFVEMTGYSREELVGQNPRIVQSGTTPSDVYYELWYEITHGHTWHGRLQNRRKNGELFWEEVHISPVHDQHGKLTNFVAIKEDISGRVKVERMKSEFISTVSHELRTPLTSIRGALALLTGGAAGDLPATVKPMLDIARRNSERLVLLVNDLLDIEKIESGKMELNIRLVVLRAVLLQAIESNQPFADQYKVRYELIGDVPDISIRVDEARLLQVFANLLSNAAKFSPVNDVVQISVTQSEQRVRVSISNHGEGIAFEFRKYIFQKFVQVDSSDTRKRGGTGLGLAIAKAIVEQMGGIIGFESEPNVLTTFFIDFPVWQDNLGESI